MPFLVYSVHPFYLGGAKHVLWTDLESKYLAFQSQMISALTTLLCGGSRKQPWVMH